MISYYFNSFVAYLRHMETQACINIGSGNSLLPDVTEPFPEVMWTFH